MKKKLLALLTAMLMLAAMLPAAAFAVTGTYTGSAIADDEFNCYYTVTTTLTVTDGYVTSVSVTTDNDDEVNDDYIDYAINGRTRYNIEYEGVPDQLVGMSVEDVATGSGIDTVSGATYTSQAIIDGAKTAAKAAISAGNASSTDDGSTDTDDGTTDDGSIDTDTDTDTNDDADTDTDSGNTDTNSGGSSDSGNTDTNSGGSTDSGNTDTNSGDSTGSGTTDTDADADDTADTDTDTDADDVTDAEDGTDADADDTADEEDDAADTEDDTAADDTAGTEEAFTFDDVTDSSQYYYTAVYWAYENGITTGTTASTFSPNDAVTRAQFVTFLYRLAGQPAVTSASVFDDVTDTSAYYYNAVVWAYENGITTGTTATTFDPTGTVTREQVVTFIYRYYGSPALTDVDAIFTDVTGTGAYYYSPVYWAYENGITTGTTATLFGTGSNCTRGQVVTFLYRAVQAAG